MTFTKTFRTRQFMKVHFADIGIQSQSNRKTLIRIIIKYKHNFIIAATQILGKRTA